MEGDAITSMFKRSKTWYTMKYIYYIGDGDSKTYKLSSRIFRMLKKNKTPYDEIEMSDPYFKNNFDFLFLINCFVKIVSINSSRFF